MRRLRPAALVAVAATLAIPPAAARATLRVEVGGDFGHSLLITDTTGGPNGLTVSQVGSGTTRKLQVATTGAVEIGPGCAPSGSTAFGSTLRPQSVEGGTIVCSGPAGGFTQVIALLDPRDSSGSDDVMRVGGAGGAGPFDYNVIVNGGGGNDTFEGGPEGDSVSGGPGNDTLKGNGGPDLLGGDLGADAVHGGDGDDSLSEGACCVLVAAGSLVVDAMDIYDGGSGTDVLHYVDGGPRVLLLGQLEGVVGAHDADLNGLADPVPDQLQSIETLTGTRQDDVLDISADARDGLRLGGGPGADLEIGGSGDDSLVGVDGDDTLRGNGGNDVVQGGNGADHLLGGKGTDVLDAKGQEALGGTLPRPQQDPEVDCGGGDSDRAVLDLLDDSTPTGCEIVERSDVFEHHHPQLGGGHGPLRLAPDDTVAVSVKCPRAQHRACKGRLTLTLARHGASRPAGTHYRVAAGRAGLVRVTLSDTELLRLRTTHKALAAIVIAHELSLRGKPKTTTRTLNVRSGSSA